MFQPYIETNASQPKKGHDWEMLLRPVLLVYRATPWDVTILLVIRMLSTTTFSALDFQLSVKRYPTVETEYGQELVKELKQA